MTNTATINDRLLRMPQVQELVPWCKAQIYREISKGRFPAPIKAGRSSFWKESEIQNFIKDLGGDSK